MTTYQIIDAAPAHLKALETTMRRRDCLEVLSLGFASPRKALWASYRASLIRRTVLVDGEVGAMWGCAGSALGGKGVPWLLTAPPIEKVPVAFVRETRREVVKMLSVFSKLENYCDAGYHAACNFLQVVGFTKGECVLMGSQQVPFFKFTLER